MNWPVLFARLLELGVIEFEQAEPEEEPAQESKNELLWLLGFAAFIVVIRLSTS